MESSSSWLVAADWLVSGVLTELPFLETLFEPEGVALEPPFADCFAAFSARRFCLDAEGAMVDGCVDERSLRPAELFHSPKPRRLPSYLFMTSRIWTLAQHVHLSTLSLCALAVVRDASVHRE